VQTAECLAVLPVIIAQGYVAMSVLTDVINQGGIHIAEDGRGNVVRTSGGEACGDVRGEVGFDAVFPNY